MCRVDQSDHAVLDQIAQIVNDQLADIRANGVSSEELNTAIAGVQREYGFQSDYQIALAAMDEQLSPTSLKDYANRTTRSIKRGDVAGIAQRFLPADNAVQVTVLPAG